MVPTWYPGKALYCTHSHRANNVITSSYHHVITSGPPSGKRPSSVQEVVWQCSLLVDISRELVVVIFDKAGDEFSLQERQGHTNTKRKNNMAGALWDSCSYFSSLAHLSLRDDDSWPKVPLQQLWLYTERDKESDSVQSFLGLSFPEINLWQTQATIYDVVLPETSKTHRSILRLISQQLRIDHERG